MFGMNVNVLLLPGLLISGPVFVLSAVLSVPKKKKLKKSDLNNKVVGDVLDAYKEVRDSSQHPPPPLSRLRLLPNYISSSL